MTTGPGVDAEVAEAQLAGAAADDRLALEHRDVVARGGEVARGGQAGEPGPDDDDPHADRQATASARSRRAASASGSTSRSSSARCARVDEVGDGLLGPLAHAGVDHRLLQGVDPGVVEGAGVAGGEQRAGRGRAAAAPAQVSSAVGLPERRSSPAGLPVRRGVAPDAEHVVAHGERVADEVAPGDEPRAPARGRRRRRARRAAAAG